MKNRFTALQSGVSVLDRDSLTSVAEDGKNPSSLIKKKKLKNQFSVDINTYPHRGKKKKVGSCKIWGRFVILSL